MSLAVCVIPMSHNIFVTAPLFWLTRMISEGSNSSTLIFLGSELTLDQSYFEMIRQDGKKVSAGDRHTYHSSRVGCRATPGGS